MRLARCRLGDLVPRGKYRDGALDIRPPIPHGPVLLVDDMVDSRWTLTVAAWLLRRRGGGPAWPLALALTGHDE